MSPSVATAADPSDDYVTLAEAVRLTGRSGSQIKALAATRQVSVDALMGCRIRYSRADLQGIARGRTAKAS